MRALVLVGIALFSFSSVPAQDTLYARKVIKFLTSKKCFGRGYVKNGLGIAADYIASELKQANAAPLFGKNYFQEFSFPVNTFPGRMKVKIDGHLLKPGVDYIVAPYCHGFKEKFLVGSNDSVYISELKDMVIHVKRKLTFSVSDFSYGICSIDVLNKGQFKGRRWLKVKVNIQNKEINSLNRNIGCYIPGTSGSDSLIVFSAHYDHLGGMGKKTFFPGANDNASGVSVLLNLIKHYKAHPPKYKTVFLFFAGEEAGLLGSKYFAEGHTIDLKKIKFLVNLDLLGTGDEGIMVVNGAVHQKEFELLNKINEEQQLVKQIRKRGKASNSDHYWFSEAGVPCFFIYTLGGVKAYHDVFDVAATLPLTDYVDVFKLITEFTGRL